jgi:hypothetical protein
MLLCVFDLICIACVSEKINKGIGPKNVFKKVLSEDYGKNVLIESSRHLGLSAAGLELRSGREVRSGLEHRPDSLHALDSSGDAADEPCGRSRQAVNVMVRVT